MVKTKFKKAVSLMLAAVMSLTAFMGIGATTAFAAVGEKADVYLVDYPRSGDTNNNGEWGHGNLNYMNGWKGLSTKYTGLRAKTSSDGKVEGFTFRVTGVNGYDRSFTTDKNGEIIIEGLRIGDYTVSEVQDTVSASYVLPADKIATVKVGSTTVVEMHNELRDTPKTGDNSNVGLWTALAGLSALGIVGTAVVAYRKKKKEDNE